MGRNTSNIFTSGNYSKYSIISDSDNIPPRSSSRTGGSRSFDESYHDTLSVDTGHYGHHGPYTDDEILLKDTESKVAVATYNDQGLAPRRSSTTAIDYHYGGIARSNLRSKSMSPSRIAPNNSYNKKSNIANHRREVSRNIIHGLII